MKATAIAIGIALAIGALPCLWLVAASYVYCKLSNHLDLFVFPWTQWLEILPDWDATFRTQLYIIIAAAFPSGFYFVVGRALVARYWGVRRQPDTPPQPVVGAADRPGSD